MRKTTAAAVTAGFAALAFAVWAGGVMVSSLYTSKILNQGCARLSSSFAQKRDSGIMPFPVKVSYKKNEGGFFEEKGVFTISSGDERELTLDAITSHGFLSFESSADLLPVLNNMFVKSNVLVMAKSGAKAIVNGRLLPSDGRLQISMGGQYSRAYLADAYPKAQDEQSLEIKLDASGLESDALKLRGSAYNIITRELKLESLKFEASKDGNEDPGSLSIKLKGVNATDLGALEAVDEATAKFSPVKNASKADFDLKSEISFKGAGGEASLKTIMGPFSKARVAERGASISDMLSQPGFLNDYFSNDKGYLRVEKIKARADTDMGNGRISFKASGRGDFSFSTKGTLDESLGTTSGKSYLEVSELSKTAEQFLMIYGANYLKRDGQNYKAEVEIENGRIKINGKDL
ncbi:MAG: hypothetical protein PUA61_04295 [Succinatimonas hippei]|nr:hypothetical protein [Succinatimonas hippei]